MKVILLIVLTIFISACSTINPGYISSKPDLVKLTTYKNTLSDVEDSLGNPAIYQISFNKLTYKYYYNTPEAEVSQTEMIKGSYLSGCKNCGQIVAIFKRSNDKNTKNYLLTGLSVSDSKLKSQTNNACILIGQHKFSEAYPILLDAAKWHYSVAEHTLGLMFINGDGVEKNYKQASYWFARAAGAEYAPALYDLGAMYKNGEGIPYNINAAKDLYEKSARLGYTLAMKELVKIYNAEGSKDKADFWTKKYEGKIK